jgi:hypothetical protein
MSIKKKKKKERKKKKKKKKKKKQGSWGACRSFSMIATVKGSHNEASG